jgi:hypothetical protein
LSWSHHCEIGKAFKDVGEIERWLEVAERGGHPKAELRRMIRSHVAGREPAVRPSGPTATANKPFALLRELRAVGRLIHAQEDTWAIWSPASCELALAEVGPIADFIAALRAKSESRNLDSRVG